ncbi:box C/D snoRNA protein 1-like [Lineus longissimus]|uniref:box C/D snoRNA protein 1-like n=1 Tax=Lineus longissimus TaxID=88925 RepID=UPI002B4F3944
MTCVLCFLSFQSSNDILMSTKLVKCKACHENTAKYKCPRCSIQTCSLKCCEQHKKDAGCNGQRDKTAYVPVKDFTDMNLLSDYRLLEDLDRSLWRYRKNKIVNGNNRPHYQIRLRKEAHHRGIKLQLLPEGFKKRKINSSVYVFSQKAIRWHIELQFPKVKQEASLIRVHEGSLLGDELKTYLNSPTTSHLLWKDFRDNFDELTLLVESEKTNSRQNLYRRVDPSKSISDNLKGHLVVEFPSIHVVTKDELGRYRLVGEEAAGRAGEESNTGESENEEPPCKPDEEPPCKRLKPNRENCRDDGDENNVERTSMDATGNEVSQSSDNRHASVDVMEIKTAETVSVIKNGALKDNGMEVQSQSTGKDSHENEITDKLNIECGEKANGKDNGNTI